MRNLLVAVTCLGVAMTIANAANAWGDEGHRVICQIAFDKVKPSTRAAIAQLIKADGQFQSQSARTV